MKRKRCHGRPLRVSARRLELSVLREDRIKVLAVIASIQFSLILVWMLWLKFGEEFYILRTYNAFSHYTLKERFLFELVPFIHTFDHDTFKRILNIALNTIVFAPFGVLFNLTFEKKSVVRDMFICLCFSIAIELTQLFTIIGSFASEDLITNPVGYLFGLAFFKLFFARLRPRYQQRLLSVCNVCLFALLVIAVIRTANCFDLIRAILTRSI